MNSQNVVEGETPPKYGLVINGEFQPRKFHSLEEAEIARKDLQRRRLDKRIEVYEPHGKILNRKT